MKIRAGFVSNSSTSSFCIFGISDSDTKLPDRFDEENDDGFEGWEAAEQELQKIDKRFVYEHMDCDAHFLGIPFTSIRDDETGAQFKQTIKDALESVLGTTVKCAVHQEAWRDG